MRANALSCPPRLIGKAEKGWKRLRSVVGTDSSTLALHGTVREVRM